MDPSGQTGLAAESAAPYRLIALSPCRLVAAIGAIWGLGAAYAVPLT